MGRKESNQTKISSQACFMQNFNILASLCSWAGWFEPCLVTNPEDRFLASLGRYIYPASANSENPDQPASDELEAGWLGSSL